MKAWNNDPELKEQMVDLAIMHRKQDEFVKGTYGEDFGGTFKACSVGCTINDLNRINGTSHNTGDHAVISKLLGIPEFIPHLQDRIFEGLPHDKAIGWTERLYSAIPCGSDLSSVLPSFLIAIQDRNLELVDKKEFPDVYKAILDVKDVLIGWRDNGEIDRSAARLAAESAESARSAESAAESAESARSAESAAWSAESARSAWLAARSAWLAAESAESARSAWLAAESAAWSAAYEWMADTLIELIEQC